MKKILAIAAAAALSCGISAFAANPFSDVTPDDWAYQAVSDLSDQGVVEGYPDGTFKGERNITRYELAQIVARLMAKEDQLNGEQKATLDKLAGEYADELANLGVRVSNLEKKVGNLSWSGDARMRINQGYEKDKDKKFTGDSTDSWNGRMRIKAHAQVNEKTSVDGWLRQDMNFKSEAAKDNKGVYMQRLYVTHKFGDATKLTVGKYGERFGQTGILHDSEVKGAELTYGGKDLNLTAGYARFMKWDDKLGAYGEGGIDKNAGDANEDKLEKEVTYARIAGEASKLNYDVEYVNAAAADYQVWGAGLTWNVADKLDVFGDYYTNVDYKGDPALWSAGLAYGKQNFKKPGTWRLAATYVKAEKGAFMGGTTWDLSAPQELALEDKSVHFWIAQADVTLQKNVGLHLEYAFDVDAKGDKTDYDDLFEAKIDYKF